MPSKETHTFRGKDTQADDFTTRVRDRDLPLASTVLGLALHVANDVIPFEFHRVYLAWKDQSELVWHFRHGFMQPESEDYERNI